MAALNLRWYHVSDFPFLFAFQVVSIVQLIAMVPFFFYISKEQFLIAYDEYFNSSLSNMVDRVRTELGDPRFYLAQLVEVKKESYFKHVVLLHRLPHMKLKGRQLRNINIFLWVIVLALSIALEKFHWLRIF